MSKVVIFGSSHFSEEVAFLVENDSLDEVVGYTVDEAYINGEAFAGKPLFSYQNLKRFFNKDEIGLIITIGYSQMNANRKRISEMCEADGWVVRGFCHSSVENHDAYIGNGNIIFDHVQLRHHASIGNGNIILANSIISHDSVIGNYNYIAGSVHLLGNSVIGDENFIGNSCIITDSTRIGNANLISAGAIVSTECKNNHVVSIPKNKIIKSNTRIMSALLMR